MAVRLKNPRTSRVIKLNSLTPRSLRLSPADRNFLRDLARVQIISHDLAGQHHYSHLKAGADRPLDRLRKAGILKTKTLHVSGNPSVRTYEFASTAMAKAWGGKCPVTGAKRTDLHELITSRLYFELGRPDDFRVAANFTKEDLSACGAIRPDAMYTHEDQRVMVEADSGQYTRAQIIEKIALWKSFGLHQQVWGQPLSASVDIPRDSLIKVIRF